MSGDATGEKVKLNVEAAKGGKEETVSFPGTSNARSLLNSI
jgi:hypothetical protein